ncbi:tetraacyldisaccharide 4'-kinase [Rhodospirillales bacterium]|nr:tetraacyldisaccharide 4'-kinase [Rhodospirillales bacterium]
MRAPEFWHNKGGILSFVLSPFGWIYSAITSMRAAAKPTWAAPIPVICIGNVVMGGAGKTLVSIDLAERLKAKGQNPHIIMRGYGGGMNAPTKVDLNLHNANDVGDEALLLARTAPTWVGARRADVAKHATEDGASVLIMDDGFQNPSLAKDLSLLVVDAEYGFGNGRVCPAGPLREPIKNAASRAHAVISLGGSLSENVMNLPAFVGYTEPTSNATDIHGERVVAFGGIGRPEKFFNSLKAAGAELTETISFPDHHPFSDAEIKNVLAKAKALNSIAITTEKDFVRIPAALRTDIMSFPVRLRWEQADTFESFILERTGLS